MADSQLPSRRSFVKQGFTAFTASSGMIPILAGTDTPENDQLLINKVSLLREMAADTYANLWKNLTGITEKEADWQPNPESNSVRWVVGHLCWFEEYVADALENTGRYLTDKKPTIVQESSMPKLKERFDAARVCSARLIESLTVDSFKKEIIYVGRFPVTIHSLLQTHTLHMSGHRYQVRYIRGTYSRVFHTNKADFDPW
ncbi:DinB family protein [Spirosoma sp. KCTC 42546]|uniref:DinB family protein n=1 Tax=Spirosoma sp. KCTC 42546 TaxID=2520506 RepID=UPI001157776D|nr:DinB family protein [Spirosoma sp. KCTC 42546]QDK81573.1 DinB family protein [Spirosoma sp. KCTC 42546]